LISLRERLGMMLRTFFFSFLVSPLDVEAIGALMMDAYVSWEISVVLRASES
jgi:hypothetical protein